ncbi:MAG: hypothetical protein IKW71_03335 [Elusimicrobiaceae bacterium]|nr:hypothetical protein [Elusimicrobiaceae bacterium]
MKNLMLCLALCLFPFAANAQNFNIWNNFHDAHKNKDIVTKLQRAVASNEKLPWVKTLQQQMGKAEPQGLMGSNLFDVVSPFQQIPLPARVEQRRALMQAALTRNPVLRYYRLSIPNPEAVDLLSDEDVRYIVGFLNAPITVQMQDKRYTPVGLEAYKRYLVRVTLKHTPVSSPVHLIFNCYSHEMYIAFPWLEIPGVTFER